MAIEYQTGIALTPGKKKVSVRLISPEYAIKQNKYKFVVPFMDESGIRFLAQVIRERIDRLRDCFVLVTGDRGLGKSTLILKLMQAVDSGATVDQVVFKLEDFGRLFNTNPQGDGSKGIYPQVIMDEAGHALYGMDWLVKEQKVIAKELIVSRIKRQILYLAVPKRKQLNNQVRDMAHIWIHVSEPEEYYQGYAVVRFAPGPIQSEFHSEKLWIPRMAFIFSEETGPLWDEYERRKIAFVDEVTDDIANNRVLGSTALNQRDDYIRELHNYHKQIGSPISQTDLGAIGGLSQQQIASILTGKRT